MSDEPSHALPPDERDPVIASQATARVEPLLSLEHFAHILGMSRPMLAALRRWMVRYHDPCGYYAFGAWQGYLIETLEHK